MANVQRFRSGHQELVSGKVKAGVRAEIGDLMFQSPDDEYVYPFGSIAVDGSGSGSGGGFTGGDAQADAKGAFLGVLTEGATSGDEAADTDCLVASDGVYEFPVPADDIDDDYPAGTPVEATVVSGFLADQMVQLASSRTDAFALLARFAPEGSTTVQIRLFSSVMGNELS